MSSIARRQLPAFLLVILAGCGSLVASYDPVFDQDLNRFSQDTAVFTAAAIAGGPQRAAASPETVAYYAAAYTVLDRLAERARQTRATVPCPTNAQLEAMPQLPAVTSDLPEDFRSFDCREFQLQAVRFYLDRLNGNHQNDGILNPGEARVYGGQLQTATIGAINTFMVTRRE